MYKNFVIDFFTLFLNLLSNEAIKSFVAISHTYLRGGGGLEKRRPYQTGHIKYLLKWGLNKYLYLKPKGALLVLKQVLG